MWQSVLVILYDKPENIGGVRWRGGAYFCLVQPSNTRKPTETHNNTNREIFLTYI